MHMLHVSALYTYVELHRSLLIFPFLSLYAVYNYTSSLLSRAWRACRGILSHLCLPLTVMSYPSHSYVMPSHSSVMWLFFLLKTAGSMQGVGLETKKSVALCTCICTNQIFRRIRVRLDPRIAAVSNRLSSGRRQTHHKSLS